MGVHNCAGKHRWRSKSMFIVGTFTLFFAVEARVASSPLGVFKSFICSWWRGGFFAIWDFRTGSYFYLSIFLAIDARDWNVSFMGLFYGNSTIVF